MEYFKRRWKPTLAGALFGGVVGYLQPLFLAVDGEVRAQQLFLAVEMSIAFAVLALLLTNYLEFRKRVRAQVMKKIAASRANEAGSGRS